MLNQYVIQNSFVSGTSWIVAAENDQQAIGVVIERNRASAYLLSRLSIGKFVVFTVPGVSLMGAPCLLGVVLNEGGFVS